MVAITLPQKTAPLSRQTLRKRLLKKVWAPKKRKNTRQKKDQRILNITAKRFNLKQGEPYPAEALLLMSNLGVKEATEAYKLLQLKEGKWE